MRFNMLEYYEMVRQNHLDIIYSGPIWGDGVEGIGDTIRKRLAHDDLSLTASKAVFTVFVEQMNNMLMYSDEKESFANRDNTEFEVSKGVFVLGTHEKTYFLQSGNIMKNENVALLKEKIDFLNSLDKDGLKKHYKEQIRSDNTNPNSKGAGLGLTEIARRASSKIQYSFEPYGVGFSFFSMEVSIGGTGQQPISSSNSLDKEVK